MTPDTPAGGAVACPHSETTPKWDHHVCTRCGAVNADSSFGIASGKWFATLGDAKFYKQHGRIPDAVTIRPATVSADAVLALVGEMSEMQETWLLSVSGKASSRHIPTIDLKTGQRGEDDFDNEGFAMRHCAQQLGRLMDKLEALTRGEK